MHTFRHFNLNSFLTSRLVFKGGPEGHIAVNIDDELEAAKLEANSRPPQLDENVLTKNAEDAAAEAERTAGLIPDDESDYSSADEVMLDKPQSNPDDAKWIKRSERWQKNQEEKQARRERFSNNAKNWAQGVREEFRGHGDNIREGFEKTFNPKKYAEKQAFKQRKADKLNEQQVARKVRIDKVDDRSSYELSRAEAIRVAQENISGDFDPRPVEGEMGTSGPLVEMRVDGLYKRGILRGDEFTQGYYTSESDPKNRTFIPEFTGNKGVLVELRGNKGVYIDNGRAFTKGEYAEINGENIFVPTIDKDYLKARLGSVVDEMDSGTVDHLIAYLEKVQTNSYTADVATLAQINGQINVYKENYEKKPKPKKSSKKANSGPSNSTQRLS